MGDPAEPSFASLLRQLRVKAGLTQEELAEAASLSPRSVSDLERGINHTARKDTAVLLADALAIEPSLRDLFIEAARGRVPASDVLAAMSAHRTNLPAPVDSFVGRQQELGDISSAVRAHRLVTLTGPGGSGKTRLALEAAAALLPEFAGGVWLVSLATIAAGERLVAAVAEALGVPDAPDQAISDTLERWFRGQDVLLILDNCEHVIAAAASFCERFLPACNRLRILATSREFLDVRGERAIQTLPLAVPDDRALAAESDAVRLFLARAEASAPAFRPDAIDLGVVLDVCRRLDGLPLAIELAAARLRALSLPQLSSRLDEHFWRVTGGSGRVGGQRSLEAVVGWSYDLLTDTEQQAFIRLSVFPHHFSAEMAEAVVADPPVDVSDVLDVLTSLVGKSLVATVNAPDGLRYRLLETLRQYGHDRLTDRGEVGPYAERLVAWAMAGVQRLESLVRTAGMDDALRQAAIDAVTYRAALRWAEAHGQPVAAVRIAGMVPLSHRRDERQAEIQRCLAAAEAAGQLDDTSAGHAWAAITNIAFERNDWPTAVAAGERAENYFRAAGLSRLAAWAQYLTMHAAWGDGQLDLVDRLVADMIASFRQENDEIGLGYSLWVASLRTDDLDSASGMAAEACDLLRRAGVPTGIAHAVEGRGIIAFKRGELDMAADFLIEALEILAAYGNVGCTAHALEAAAMLVAAADKAGLGPAADLLGAARELRRQSGQGHVPWEIRARLGALDDRVLEERVVPRRIAGDTRAPPATAAEARVPLSAASALAVEALRALAGSAPYVPTGSQNSS